jgi:hypothetical protein
MPLSVASGFASENVYGCITSSSTFTAQDSMTGGTTGNCATVKSGSFAGTVPFGEQSSSGLSQYGPSQSAKATLIVANSTTFTASCWAAASTTTSVSVSGYCHISAVPY